MKSVVIAFSGGLDSTTLLYSLLKEVNVIHAVFFNYGSRHNEQELIAAEKILEPFRGIKFTKLDISSKVFQGSTSALLTDAPMPSKSYEELSSSTGPSPTVVPFRNAIILSECTAIAASKGYDAVAIATHATDYHNWAYPDCSPEFIGAMANAIYIGTYSKVRLHTPFMWMTKSDIVAKAVEVNAPVHLTRSCYQMREIACGVCPTCVERIQAFRNQGYVDPIEYMGFVDWWNCMPWPHKLENI